MSSFVNDPIADMLTRIRNAGMARKAELSMPYSKMKEAIARILKDNHFIADFSVEEVAGFRRLNVSFPDQGSGITTLIRMSKPGRRMYVGVNDIPLVLGGRGLVILSTSAGVMSGREARRQGLGGELICKVW